MGKPYQRSDGRWAISVELPSTSVKRKRKYLYGTSRKEVQKKYNDLIYKLDNNLYKDSNGMSFVYLLRKWHEVHSSKAAETTNSLYLMYINVHIEPYFGTLRLDKLDTMKLDEFYNYKLKSLAPNTVLKLHKLIKQGLSYARKVKLIAFNPADDVSLPSSTKPRYVVYNEADFEKLLTVVKGTFDEIPILLAGAVGMRRGEIFGLKWSDIDFRNKTININETIVRYDQYTIKEPKTESSIRTIKVYDFVLEVLLRYRRSNEVISFRVCDKYKPGYYSERFKKILIDNKLKLIRFHDLRHFNATLMLKYGISDKLASERLGHSDTTMLRTIYQHSLEEMHDEAANTLNDVFTKRNTK